MLYMLYMLYILYYIDSAPLSVCKNQRIHKQKININKEIHKHKTFKNLAERGKCYYI